ncbi:MAG TPA: hypothetical protein VGF13_05645, partial [Verrucomicrobiae bacterium]
GTRRRRENCWRDSACALWVMPNARTTYGLIRPRGRERDFAAEHFTALTGEVAIQSLDKASPSMFSGTKVPCAGNCAAVGTILNMAVPSSASSDIAP